MSKSKGHKKIIEDHTWDIAKALTEAKAKYKQRGKWKEIASSMPKTPHPTVPPVPNLPADIAVSEDENITVAPRDDYDDPVDDSSMVKAMIAAAPIKSSKYANFTGQDPMPPSPPVLEDTAYLKLKKVPFSRQFGEAEKLEIEFERALNEIEAAVMPSNEEDVEVIRRSLVIERIAERMNIIVVATDVENPQSNEINMIKCSGEPLGCYAYDCNTDAYYVNCKAFAQLGAVSVAYRIASQGDADTNNVIALPDELIEKYLAPTQKKALKLFREKFKEPRYKTCFMQAINC